MSQRIWDSAGAVTGIIFVVLLIVGMGVTGNVMEDLSPSDSSSKIAQVLDDRSDRAEIGSLIALSGLVFFFGFLAFLRRQLQQAEGEVGWLTSMAYGGGLVTVAMVLIGLSFQLATTSASAHLDTQVAKAFYVYQWNYIWVLAPPMIALTLGASLVIVRYGALPKWTGWIGFLVSVTLLMPWIGVIVTLGWILLISVVLLVKTLKVSEPLEQN